MLKETIQIKVRKLMPLGLMICLICYCNIMLTTNLKSLENKRHNSMPPPYNLLKHNKFQGSHVQEAGVIPA